MKRKLLTALTVLMLSAIALPVTTASAGKSTPPTLTTLSLAAFVPSNRI